MGASVHGRPKCRSWVVTFILCLLLLTSRGALAADPVPTCSDYPGLRTGTLHFSPVGSVVGATGAEFLPDVNNEVAGIRGDLLRAPVVGLRLGLSENAEFQVSWPAHAWMWVHAQHDPPILGRRLGGLTSDFGDVTVATLIRLHDEGSKVPACGLKFAAKLPNSNEQLGIGDNTTDVFASGLLAKSFAARVTLYGDLGLGILTEPTKLFQQNDVLTYGFMSDTWIGGSKHLLGEIAGHVATHPGGPGTATSAELRTGIGVGAGRWTMNALVIRGLAAGDSRAFGFAMSVASRFQVFGSGPASRAGSVPTETPTP